jgi:hypothetical protein
MPRSKAEFTCHIILNIARVLPALPRGAEQVGDGV